MRNLKHVCSMIVLALLLGVGCCSPKESESLAVTLHPQETGMWCWAASGQMVMHYLGNDVAQCTQANNRFSRNDCCNNPVPNACIQGGWPEFPKYNFSFVKTTNAALSWDQLKAEISGGTNCGNRPFCFTWASTGGGGHTMVAIGYNTISLLALKIHMVEVNDPWPPNIGGHRWITYAAYVSGPGYTHWDDYYQVKHTGGD
jgi:hypothetical protein